MAKKSKKLNNKMTKPQLIKAGKKLNRQLFAIGLSIPIVALAGATGIYYGVKSCNKTTDPVPPGPTPTPTPSKKGSVVVRKEVQDQGVELKQEVTFKKYETVRFDLFVSSSKTLTNVWLKIGNQTYDKESFSLSGTTITVPGELVTTTKIIVYSVTFEEAVPTGMTLSTTSQTIKLNKSFTIKADLTYSNAYTISWSQITTERGQVTLSSETSTSGEYITVTGVSAGDVELTATCNTGTQELTETCSITVSESAEIVELRDAHFTGAATVIDQGSTNEIVTPEKLSCGGRESGQVLWRHLTFETDYRVYDATGQTDLTEQIKAGTYHLPSTPGSITFTFKADDVTTTCTVTVVEGISVEITSVGYEGSISSEADNVYSSELFKASNLTVKGKKSGGEEETLTIGTDFRVLDENGDDITEDILGGDYRFARYSEKQDFLIDSIDGGSSKVLTVKINSLKLVMNRTALSSDFETTIPDYVESRNYSSLKFEANTTSGTKKGHFVFTFTNSLLETYTVQTPSEEEFTTTTRQTNCAICDLYDHIVDDGEWKVGVVVTFVSDQTITKVNVAGERNIDIDNSDSITFTATDQDGNDITNQCSFTITNTVDPETELGRFEDNNLALNLVAKTQGGSAKITATYENEETGQTITSADFEIEIATFNKLLLESTGEYSLKTGWAGQKDTSVSGAVVIPSKYFISTSDGFMNTTGLTPGGFNATGITSIYVPRTIRNIPGSSITTPNLATIVVDKNNATYTSKNSSGDECNCIVNASEKSLIKGCIGTTIPDDGSVTTIYDMAFKNSGITSVTIPATIVNINQQAFIGCSSLTTVTIAEGSVLEVIDSSAFNGCSSWTTDELVIPSSVYKLGANCFKYCNGINKISFAGTTTTSYGNWIQTGDSDKKLLNTTNPTNNANYLRKYEGGVENNWGLTGISIDNEATKSAKVTCDESSFTDNGLTNITYTSSIQQKDGSKTITITYDNATAGVIKGAIHLENNQSTVVIDPVEITVDVGTTTGSTTITLDDTAWGNITPQDTITLSFVPTTTESSFLTRFEEVITTIPTLNFANYENGKVCGVDVESHKQATWDGPAWLYYQLSEEKEVNVYVYYNNIQLITDEIDAFASNLYYKSFTISSTEMSYTMTLKTDPTQYQRKTFDITNGNALTNFVNTITDSEFEDTSLVDITYTRE